MYVIYYNISMLQSDLTLCGKRSKTPYLITLLEKTFARIGFCGISMQTVKKSLWHETSQMFNHTRLLRRKITLHGHSWHTFILINCFLV